MLNDEIVDNLSEILVKRIEQGNKYVLQEIGKKIKKIKTLSSSDANKIANILKYGGDYEKIANKLAKITNLNKKDIYKIFDEVAKKDYKFDKQFYEYRKLKYIPYDKNTELKRLVRAIADKTANEYVNIAGSNNIGLGIVNPKTKEIEFKVLKEAYNTIIDEAILNISTGRETFDTMMKRTYNELDKGLKVVYPTTYIGKDGKEHHYTKSVDSAIRQNVSDGLSQLQQEMQKEVGKQFDSDGVEITVVYNPAPDHAEVQGRQFKNEEFEKFQNDETAVDYKGKVFEPEYDGRDRRSIGQYNCRHLVYSIILGVNIPQYDDKKLQEIIDKNNKGFTYKGKQYTNYEGSQMQRRLESEIRKNKIAQISARARGNDESILKAQQNITKLNKEYKNLCNAGGFTKRDDLLKVSGYSRVNVNRLNIPTSNDVADSKYNVVQQDETPKLKESDYIDYDEQLEKVMADFYLPYEEKTKNLTQDQYKAINEITHDKYSDIQHYLLGDIDDYGSSLTNEQLEKIVKDLDSVLDNNEIDKNVILYRGTLAKFYDKYNVGEDINEKEMYVFASLQKGIATSFCEEREKQLAGYSNNKPLLLKILAPKGTKGFYTDWIGIGEEEFILSRKPKKYRYLRKELIKHKSYFKGEKELEQIVLEIIK